MQQLLLHGLSSLQEGFSSSSKIHWHTADAKRKWGGEKATLLRQQWKDWIPSERVCNVVKRQCVCVYLVSFDTMMQKANDVKGDENSRSKASLTRTMLMPQWGHRAWQLLPVLSFLFWKHFHLVNFAQAAVSSPLPIRPEHWRLFTRFFEKAKRTFLLFDPVMGCGMATSPILWWLKANWALVELTASKEWRRSCG